MAKQSVWKARTGNFRTKFVLVAVVFANEAPPDQGAPATKLSLAWLATTTGWTARTVRKHLMRLVEDGFVRAEVPPLSEPNTVFVAKTRFTFELPA